MTEAVLDASAVTAVLRKERGFETVLPFLRGGVISALNLAEVLCTAQNYGSDIEMDHMAIAAMELRIVPFDEEQAKVVASIYQKTKGSTVGIADRACLALGLLQQLPVITGDHAWQQHDVGVEVKLFRERHAA